MPDYKEMYLHLFRETERAVNIQINAQQQCEEMYIDAPEQELRVLPKQDENDTRIYVSNMPDYKGLYHHLFQEIHKAVLVLMDAQIHCEGMSADSAFPELIPMSGVDQGFLPPQKRRTKKSQT